MLGREGERSPLALHYDRADRFKVANMKNREFRTRSYRKHTAIFADREAVDFLWEIEAIIGSK